MAPQKKRSGSLAAKINAGLISGLIILLIVGITAYQNMRSLDTAAETRKRSFETQLELDNWLQDVINAETGQRGFLLTGRESYLEPYTQAVDQRAPEVAKLKQLVEADSTRAQIDEIEKLVRQKLDELNETIKVYRTKGPEAARTVVLTDKGKNVMDQIRGRMEVLSAAEQQETARASQRVAQLESLTQITIVVATALASLIVIGAIAGISRDLATRKKIQEALAESEAQQRAIIDNMVEGMIVADKQGNFTLFNQAAEKILGVGMMQASPDQWAKTYGTYLPDKITPFPTEQFPLVRAVRGEETHGVQMYIKNTHLQAGKFISVTGSPLKDAHGQTIGGIAMFDDITDQKEASEKLLLEKNKAEATLSSIGDGVFAIDASGRVVLFNKAAQVMSGFSDMEVLNEPYKDKLVFQSEEDGTLVESFITTALRGKKAEMAQHTLLKRKDGTTIPVADSAAPIFNAGGKVDGAVVVFRDITRERQLEHMKDEFLSVASHELRTPMGAIRANLSMILGGDYGRVNKSLVEPLTDMKASTIRLVDLVNDLLNVARIEAGRMKFTLVEFDVTAAVKTVVANLAPLGKEKKVTVRMDKAKPAKVRADRDKIEQVVTNLVGNSLKFTDSGSIVISVEAHKELVEIDVLDTGIGISGEDQKKLFGKFKQITSAQDGKPPGTGLGLYISREIIRKLGGELWIKSSTVGQGSVFAFTLPRAGTVSAEKVKQAIEREAELHPDQR